ncbi:hypothetical protein EVAR_61250_1 [Eumeta japonica]|uniref:Uncharacterized protein n=1 Tax=Eumeta variegata TaxID=151549 RepID=A0A4C1Z6W3_EUMVA|nr:hypothetical protein EVAR_61250_1 [Eumeta japonica]
MDVNNGRMSKIDGRKICKGRTVYSICGQQPDHGLHPARYKSDRSIEPKARFGSPTSCATELDVVGQPNDTSSLSPTVKCIRTTLAHTIAIELRVLETQKTDIKLGPESKLRAEWETKPSVESELESRTIPESELKFGTRLGLTARYVFLRDKQACVSLGSRRAPPPMDTFIPRGGTSALPAFQEGVRYFLENLQPPSGTHLPSVSSHTDERARAYSYQSWSGEGHALSKTAIISVVITP